MTTITVTPTSILAALKAAQPGDIVKPESGLYGRIVGPTTGLNLAGVTLDAEGAQIDGQMWFTRVHGLAVRGGVWTGGMRFDAPAGADIEGVDARGDGGVNSYGVFVNSGSEVHVRSSDFTGHKSGVALNKVVGFSIIASSFRRSRNDCCSLYGVRSGRVAHNRFLDTAPATEAEHPDAVQLASLPDAVVEDVLIERNLVWARQSQGLTGFDGPFNRVTIQDNEVCVGFPHAIALYALDGTGNIVRRNRVSTWDGSRWQAGINLIGDVLRQENEVAEHSTLARVYPSVIDPVPPLASAQALAAERDALAAKLQAVRLAAA